MTATIFILVALSSQPYSLAHWKFAQTYAPYVSNRGGSMMDNQPQPTDDNESFESFAPRLSREAALRRRWGKLATRTILHQIFELLSQQADHQMYLAEIARTLGKDRALVSREIRHLEWTGVVEVEKREGRVFRHTERRGRRVYYRLRPGMAEQYQEWLASQKPDEPQP